MTFIHEDDCPFTETELTRALELAYPPERAGELASGVATSARGVSTSIVPPAISREYLILPDSWFALIAALEPALEERVNQWRLEQRMPRTSRERNAMFAAGLSPRDPPTPEIVEQLAEEDRQQEVQWNGLRDQVTTLLRLPFEERFHGTREPPAT